MLVDLVVLDAANGRVCGAVETRQDISKQKDYQAQLKACAQLDALTGLANRLVLDERLKLALSQAARRRIDQGERDVRIVQFSAGQ